MQVDKAGSGGMIEYMAKQKQCTHTLVGVGLPTPENEDIQSVPVTFVQNGRMIVVYVDGLHPNSVSVDGNGDGDVDPELGRDAVQAVKLIYTWWAEGRDRIIDAELSRDVRP